MTNINYVKHYLGLAIWGGSLGAAIHYHEPKLGVLALIVFFLFTTWSYLKWLIIGIAAVVLLCAIFPILAPFAMLIAIIGILLRIRFIWRNRRAIFTGLYAYGSYLALLYLPEIERMAEYQPYFLPAAAAATVILHGLVYWLYKNGYDTDRAFGIMGLTPLIIIAFVIPFVRLPIMESVIDVLIPDSIVPDAVSDAVGSVVRPVVAAAATGSDAADTAQRANEGSSLVEAVGDKACELGGRFAEAAAIEAGRQATQLGTDIVAHGADTVSDVANTAIDEAGRVMKDAITDTGDYISSTVKSALSSDGVTAADTVNVQTETVSAENISPETVDNWTRIKTDKA
ncbi:MAG: hypothetical protein Q4D07_07785 [Selenomonadaceae bacterium]|nr:hypothetical protein [Selenomonadaceae bacterium]